MNARIFSVVMAVMLVSLSTGCSGMRNFLFGRGARCGLCQRLSGVGNALNPLAPAPYAPPARGPAPQNYGWPGEATCGYEGPACGYEGPGCGYEAPGCGYEAPICGDCTGSGYAGGGYVTSSYGSVSDPYSNGQYSNGQYSNGQYSNGQYLPGPVLPYDGQVIQGPVVSDDWNPREGEIVQPESLPPGVQNQQ